MSLFSSMRGYVKSEGLIRLARRTLAFLEEQKDARRTIRSGWDQRRIDNEKQSVSGMDVWISILVCLSDSSERHLAETIASVQRQSYENWELCIAYSGDEKDSRAARIGQQLTDKDKRIRFCACSDGINACMGMTSGAYIALLETGDVLHRSALFEVAQTITRTDADFVYTDDCAFRKTCLGPVRTIHRKPDYAPDNLKSYNYINHLAVFSRKLFDQSGGYRLAYDRCRNYDLYLRLTRQARRVEHIPHLLYFERSHAKKSQERDAQAAAMRAVEDSIRAQGYMAKIETGREHPSLFRIHYELKRQPHIDILIPNRNSPKVLDDCVRSILNQTSYPHYKILILDNGSDSDETEQEYEALRQTGAVRILRCDMPFNFSRLINIGAREAQSDYLLLLNNDTRVISPGWMEEMMMYAQREDVGAVGAMLLFPDETVQHAGIALGLGADRCAGHVYYGQRSGAPEARGRMDYAQDVSAVTAACMLVRKDHFAEVGGFDETFPIAYNDVDFCLKLRAAGYVNVWTPFARLYHDESRSRGQDVSQEKKERLHREALRMRDKWKIDGDPYYQNAALRYR